jgi:hypothetical protein
MMTVLSYYLALSVRGPRQELARCRLRLVRFERKAEMSERPIRPIDHINYSGQMRAQAAANYSGQMRAQAAATNTCAVCKKKIKERGIR